MKSNFLRSSETYVHINNEAHIRVGDKIRTDLGKQDHKVFTETDLKYFQEIFQR